MPLPHFLLLIAAVIAAAAATLWFSLSNGVPLMVLAMVVLIAAGLVHVTRRDHRL
ncbi:hypothetical protein [Paracoccus sp. SCSIO 75233]|uniref:hypothetical protein n=1 Tax=Paracoccus sp. SCSIO 75233 TaxID=3017782 RepID=UPI0022F0CFB7|nr:hypothetical protein [Paracoccus sp. SCSIO 75233]WBU51918.1 hypothetical protein PAF12_08665 [Paracoccus sp. SCSIO 75233]